MKVSCQSCSSVLNIDDKKIPPGGARIKCPVCQQIFPVKPSAASAPAGAVPLPGPSAPEPQSWEDESTRVARVPLPAAAYPEAQRSGGSSPGAVPLPGISAPSTGRQEWEDEATRVALPIPGPSAPVPATSRAAVPLPAPLPAPVGNAVPLPGVAASPRAQPRPESAPPALETSVPLPGGAIALGTSEPTAHAVPLPGEADPMEFDFSDGPAPVPLPAPPESSPFDFSMSGGEIGAPPAPTAFDRPFEVAPPAAAPARDFGAKAAPEPGVAGSFDFDPTPMPPALESFDFDSTPMPPSLGSFDFDALPPPPGPASADPFDLGAPGGGLSNSDLGFDPSPASGGLDFSSPPPPISFGEVDFGGAAAGNDHLEADLNAPLAPSSPAQVGPADGLEMLSFIDESAKDAGVAAGEASSIRRFHVKRRSGKVFGPFEDAVIAKMLEDGQLLGNEEVSLDAESWHPIGTESAFEAVIARLMATPSASQLPEQIQAKSQPGDDANHPSMDRLKQLYEGRMAAVAVVQSKDPISVKKWLPLVGAGVLVAALLTAGVVVGVVTPYGYFGLKLLFPATVKPDSREFGYLQSARKGLLQDTWKSYKAAREAANQALQIKDYPEARALWCQAVFALDRKFGKVDPAELQQANDELANIRLLGEKHPEVLKTQASAALNRKDADAALASIADAVARDGDDLESLFLRAEAYLLKKQPTQAKAEFEGILKKAPSSAKALHGLGLLHKQQNEINEAAGRFAEALEADPSHVASAVELAEIAIIRRKELDRGTELLNAALSDEGRPNLSPGALGKALALKAETLVVQGKLTEAVPLFEEALKVDPTNAFTNGRLARTYVDLNQADKAAPLFLAAVKAAPENLEYTEGHLSSLIAQGKMDEASKTMTAAATRFPGNATLAYLAGRVADGLDDVKAAEDAYRRAIAADPKIADAYLYFARLLMRSLRFPEVASLLENGVGQAPDSAPLRVELAELAIHERDFDKAEIELKKALELNPNSAEAYLGQSRVSLSKGKLDLAATQVEKALKLSANLPGGQLQRGATLWKLGRLDEAVTELEAAHAADPKNTQVTVTLGAVKLDQGDLDGALKHLSAALVAEPSHADGNFFLARVKHAKHENSQAIEAMKRALDAKEKNPIYLYWYARILAASHASDEALSQLKQALEIDPKYADALETMGRIYFDRNDFTKAVAAYQQALAADPSRNSARTLIGDTQMKLEDWSGAIASYTQAMAADPQLKEVYSRLGLAYQEKKQWVSAISWYRKAVEVEPENADGWLALGYLYKDTAKKKDASTAFRKYLELRPEADNKAEIADELEYLK